jgi:Uma2 family endonuclease
MSAWLHQRIIGELHYLIRAWRDETIKRRLYEKSGVSEYWVVDPEVDVVRVYRAGDNGFGKPTEWSLEAGDVVTTPLLSGLELPLSRIFRP